MTDDMRNDEFFCNYHLLSAHVDSSGPSKEEDKLRTLKEAVAEFNSHYKRNEGCDTIDATLVEGNTQIELSGKPDLIRRGKDRGLMLEAVGSEGIMLRGERSDYVLTFHDWSIIPYAPNVQDTAVPKTEIRMPEDTFLTGLEVVMNSILPDDQTSLLHEYMGGRIGQLSVSYSTERGNGSIRFPVTRERNS